MEYYTADRKKDHLPFATAWVKLENILLSEINQAVKKKIPYDLTYKWNLIKKTNKQKRIRDMET